MEKSKQQKPSSNKNSLKDVSGGYITGIDKDTIGIFNDKTKQLITKATMTGDNSIDREVFKGLTEVDIEQNKRR